NLLYESLSLKTAALDSASESLYTIGMSAFNFDQEITRKIMSTPLPITASRILLEPFMELKKIRNWSLLTVFEGQKVEKPDTEDKNNNFLSFTKSAEEVATLKRRQATFEQIFKILRHVMGNQIEITLKEAIEAINQLDTSLLKHRELYHFWLILHQRSPVPLEEIQVNEEHIFYEAFKTIGPFKTIFVDELPENLIIEEQFEVKNMRLRLVGEQNA
ncbi:MAG: hypothetical protein H7X94_01185, partial [Vallitaleaceae bacterium]|nr:hypothetical protein [Vallitaleaceae bacterium]